MFRIVEYYVFGDEQVIVGIDILLIKGGKSMTSPALNEARKSVRLLLD